MIDFTIETRIEAPATAVFDRLTDPDSLSLWQTNTVSAVKETEGPVGVGTRIREVHAAGRREFESLVEVSEFTPAERFSLQVIEGTPVHAQVTLSPQGNGTLMRFRVHGQMRGVMRILSPVLAVGLRSQFRASCERLRELVERNLPAAT
jgi:uncharacterized protein YndB with AHSA1/START domain